MSIKKRFKHSLLALALLFLFPNKRPEPKTLLLVRLDGIGDYILFRNFIAFLAESEKYKEYQITLLGNIAWKELAEELDATHIAKFLWVDKRKIYSDIFYRYKKIKELCSHSYEVILNPRYSREFSGEDQLIKYIHAQEKIASVGNTSNRTEEQKEIGNAYYTSLVPAQKDVLFEFYRNKEFFNTLLSKNICIKKPTLDGEKHVVDFFLPQRYAIIFLGASVRVKKWSVEKFAEVATHLHETYCFAIVLCGGPADVEDAEQFRRFFKWPIIDLTGKTSLVDMIPVIQKSSVVISNDTSAAHIGVAVDVATIVICNSTALGRFVPYPAELTERYSAILHPLIVDNEERHKYHDAAPGICSWLDIDEIETRDVISEVDELLTDLCLV